MKQNKIEQMFRHVREKSGAPDHIVFSSHGHNDIGLAVANALADPLHRTHGEVHPAASLLRLAATPREAGPPLHERPRATRRRELKLPRESP